MRPLPWPLLGALVMLGAGPAAAASEAPADCSGSGGDGPSRCLYRSALPSAGIVADCASDRDCHVGYYYGGPEKPTWFTPPPEMSKMPKPDVLWHTATFAETRFECGRGCTWSYFFEARRHLLSAPRRDVLDADYRRLLMAQVEGRALAIRQIYSAREVLRLERDWTPGLSVGEAIKEIRFDPDGRLAFTWLKGPARDRVSERVTVPSFAR
jgi:hypothetical protein